MPTARKTRPAPRAAARLPFAPDRRPDVIVDFEIRNGLLFVVLKNIGMASAYGVRTRFDRAFRGLNGAKDLTTLALFRELEFLPPGKEFRQLVDPIAAYFARQEPSRLSATVTYTSREGHRFKEVIPHNLEIYRDLGDAGALQWERSS